MNSMRRSSTARRRCTTGAGRWPLSKSVWRCCSRRGKGGTSYCRIRSAFASVSSSEPGIIPLPSSAAGVCSGLVYHRDAIDEAAFDLGVLGLRSRSRTRRRQRPARWHRSQCAESACRGDIFPDAAASRVRRCGDVVVLLRRLVDARRSGLHRDSGFSVTIFPALVHLCFRRRAGYGSRRTSSASASPRPNTR